MTPLVAPLRKPRKRPVITYTIEEQSPSRSKDKKILLIYHDG
jgi:hypothetical protein